MLSGVDAEKTAEPPVAVRKLTQHDLHGDRRVDAYDWLRETQNPEVTAYLAAERSFYDSATRHLYPQVRTLSEELSKRVPATDSSISYRRVRFVYYTRTPTGSEYEQLCRGLYQAETPPDSLSADAHVLLDPRDLLGESTYVDLGLTLISPDERLLAYSVDITGEEVFELRFRDTDTGQDLPDAVLRTYYGGAWSADSCSFFYTVHDEKYRPFQVWRHRLGTSVESDSLVWSEPDERYELDVRATRSGDVVEIASASRDTTEVWLLDAHDPEAAPRCVEPRRRGVEYRVEHVRCAEASDLLFVVTNDDAVEFRLMAASLDQPGRTHWREVVPEDPAERLCSATAFAGHLVTTLRRDGRLRARAYPLTADGSLGEPIDIVASVAVGTLEPVHNELYDADHLTVVEQSYSSPPRWYAVDLATGERSLLKTQEVPGLEPDLYVSESLLAPSLNGAPRIPVTVVRHIDTPLDRTAPCLLYGYGAYEACDEPAFDTALTCLLDRGVVYAHAHIRGGGEGGRRWWLDGRLEHKQNTFTDHIAVADFLAAELVDGDRLVTRGLSAGGLLQGAVFDQAPARWAGVIAEVPFVDVLTTMLDADVPLTVNEWDEWGDPRRPDDYAWMRAYSPYDNLPPAGSRPDLLVTGAVHDPRVMVFEPAKWVAALRHTDPQWSPRCVFRVELGAGAHVGPSGRYAQLRYEAEVYAWALDRFGLAPRP